MAVITAQNFGPPNTNADQGANHQIVKASPSVASTPSFFTVAPVAQELKQATVGVSYSELISAAGGTAPYTFTITGGSLPTGLSMSSGGLISGIATAVGSSVFTVKATDSNGFSGTQSFTISVVAAASGGGSYVFIS